MVHVNGKRFMDTAVVITISVQEVLSNFHSIRTKVGKGFFDIQYQQIRNRGELKRSIGNDIRAIIEDNPRSFLLLELVLVLVGVAGLAV